MTKSINGFVLSVIFRNEENGYTVFELESDAENICCVGNIASVNEGEYLELTGDYVHHNIYGRQFKIEEYSVRIPQDVLAIRRYLGSGALRGVGAVLAERIVKKFGDDSIRIINEEPERLAEIKGISVRKAMEISRQMIEKNQLQNDMIFLARYGISLTLSLKIHQKYNGDFYTILQENPYKLAEDIDGIGFKTADSIALQSGIRKDSPFRLQSGLLYALNSALNEGNIYLPKNELLERTAALLDTDVENLDKPLTDLMLEKKIIIKRQRDEEDPIAYTSKAYYMELDIAVMLDKLNVSYRQDDDFIDSMIKSIQKEDGIVLDELQKKAVQAAASNGIFILTGGPGTGKTTIINTILKCFEAKDMEILLGAPTGRAAKRMQEATGHEASTIHRMLEIFVNSEESGRALFNRNKENPLEADVIIIDESSMIDIFIMHALLSATLAGTRIIFVGDVNQLPSVGPGRILYDMISSEAFEVIKLTRIFRQAASSDIVVNAHKINAGEQITPDNKSKDFFFLRRHDVRVIQKVVVTLVDSKLPEMLNVDSREIQVLTPTRKGPLGVESLNGILQKYTNPPDPDKAEYEHRSILFREGDKVMQIKNNYELEWEILGKYNIVIQNGKGIFNGDLGVIKDINTFLETLTVEFDDGRRVVYGFKQLDELELAYAMTVHKSQGSEYPAVVIPILSGPPKLLTRNLLYTAVTRAKNCVILTGDIDTFHEMIENKSKDERYTTLAKRIREVSINI